MREIVVRSLTSQDWVNRDYRVTEVMRQAGELTRVMRRCTYRVEGRVTVPSMPDSIRWARTVDRSAPRRVYVTKEFNPETGHEQVTYKVLGHLYVVLDRDVYCVGYRHILAMGIAGASA